MYKYTFKNKKKKNKKIHQVTVILHSKNPELAFKRAKEDFPDCVFINVPDKIHKQAVKPTGLYWRIHLTK